MDDIDDPSAASIEAARRARDRERVEFVQAAGDDVIGIDESGKILMNHHTEHDDDQTEATR